MSQLEKVKKKLLSRPRDFTWTELSKLLHNLDYKEHQSGKTSGSRVRFIHPKHEPIILHKPHPRPALKQYQLKQIIEILTNRGQI